MPALTTQPNGAHPPAGREIRIHLRKREPGKARGSIRSRLIPKRPPDSEANNEPAGPAERGLDLAGAILRRELLGAPRRTRFYLSRIAGVVLAALVMGWGLGASSADSEAVGLAIFLPLSLAALGGLSLIALGTSAYLIWREREDRTLELVLISDISIRPFLWGKLAAALVLGVAGILATLPLFMLCISLGGISAPQILVAALVLLSTLFLAGSVGLYCGASARSERGILGKAAGIAALYLGAFPILAWVLLILLCFLLGLFTMYGTVEILVTHAFTVLSPIAAMVHAGSGSSLLAPALNAGLNALVAWRFVRMTPGKLRCHEIPGTDPLSLQALREKRRFIVRARRMPGPLVSMGNPVVWRDFNILFGGTQSSAMTIIRWCAITAPLALLWGFAASSGYRHSAARSTLDFVHGSTLMVFCVSSLVLVFGSISRFGMAFGQRELRDGCLELLFLSGLSDGDIIWGKIGAVMKSIVPWTLTVAGSGFLTLLLAAVIEEGWPVIWLEFAAAGLCLWLAGSAGALWTAMRFGRGAALGGCLAFALLWLLLLRWLLQWWLMELDVLSGRDGISWLLDLVLPLAVGLLAMVGVFRGFHRAALGNGR